MRAALMAFLLCGLGFAQTTPFSPSVDLYGGYSYLNIDTNGLTSSRQSANGWQASVSINLWKYLAAEGDFAGYYKNNVLGTGVNAHDYEFSGGPRFNYRYVFGHALFGEDQLSGSLTGLSISASQNSFAVIIGGGVQYPIAPHWSVRGSVDWALTHHNVLGGPRVDQNNFRAGAGIVFTFGRGARSREAAEAPRSCGTNGPPRSMTLADVGLAGDSLSVYGFHITSIAPGSAAEKSELMVGDYIVSVNCTPVKNERDVLEALSRASGTALVEITKPTWLTNHTEIHKLDVGGRQ